MEDSWRVRDKRQERKWERDRGPTFIDLLYPNIDNLDGGMNAWTASSRQLVRLNRQSRPRASPGAAPRAAPGLVEPPPAGPPI